MTTTKLTALVALVFCLGCDDGSGAVDDSGTPIEESPSRGGIVQATTLATDTGTASATTALPTAAATAVETHAPVATASATQTTTAATETSAAVSTGSSALATATATGAKSTSTFTATATATAMVGTATVTKTLTPEVVAACDAASKCCAAVCAYYAQVAPKGSTPPECSQCRSQVTMATQATCCSKSAFSGYFSSTVKLGACEWTRFQDAGCS